MYQPSRVSNTLFFLLCRQDTDVSGRRDDPEHYGLIAPGMRGTLAFVCMILNGALLLIVRSTSTALLLEVGGRYAASFYLADWTIFFTQKWLRNDAGYFFKVSDSSLVQFLIGTLLDWVVKVVADFTGLVWMMQPGLVGGVYWTTSMVSGAQKK